MTNAEMFRRVFGFRPAGNTCLMPDEVAICATGCEACKYDSRWNEDYTAGCEACKYDSGWNESYTAGCEACKYDSGWNESYTGKLDAGEAQDG